MSAAARRWRRPDVRAVAIWNLQLDNGLLWQRLGLPRVEALREAGRAEPEIGAELAETAAAALRLLRERHRFERTFVGGGLTLVEDFEQQLRRRVDHPIDVSPDGRFAGERGGLALLEGRGGGAVVDVGQTAIKVSCSGRRLVRERNLRALPLELIDPTGAPPQPAPDRLERAAAFVGGAIAELGSSGDSLVLALPCPLDDACVPGPCTYGWAGEARLVPAILERSGKGFREVLVLNDAELAAETALASRPREAGERVLVLTLGFGPGAALIGPSL